MSQDVAGETRQQPSALEGLTMHGADEPRGQSGVPLSPLFEGRFGRMFRGPAGSDRRPRRQRPHRARPGDGEAPSGPSDNPDIPAGLHVPRAVHRPRHHLRPGLAAAAVQRPRRAGRLPHAALRPRLALRRAGPPTAPTCTSGRTPAPRRAAAGRAQPASRTQRQPARPARPAAQRAGPRAHRRSAQRREHHRLPAAPGFVRFHNHVVDARGARPAAADGRGAVRRSPAHGPLALPVGRRARLPPRSSARTSRRRPAGSAAGPTVNLAVLRAGATSRSSRSSSRAPPIASATAWCAPSYDLNDTVQGVPMFSAAGRRRPDASSHLGGFRPLPSAGPRLAALLRVSTARSPSSAPHRHTSPAAAQAAGRLDSRQHPLAVLNLRRGKALRLPSGQAVAAGDRRDAADRPGLGLATSASPPQHAAALEAETPLWYYVLREAERAPRTASGSARSGAGSSPRS